jgi:hypothetical protein
MKELDDDSYQNRETFARYGLAMYHAQCVEKSLAMLVSCVFNKEFLQSTRDRREEIQNEEFSKTMWRLLKRLKKQITIPPNLDKTLSESLEKRNWLAHDYFLERGIQMMTPKGKKEMIEELTSLSDYFSKLDAHLTKIYESAMKKLGITETADEGVKRLIQKAEKNI